MKRDDIDVDIDTDSCYWVVVKIMVPVWVLGIIRHLVFLGPKRGHQYACASGSIGPSSLDQLLCIRPRVCGHLAHAESSRKHGSRRKTT